MTTTFGITTRPGAGSEARARSRHRPAGLALAIFGLMLAMVSLAGSLAAGSLARSAGAAEDVAMLATWGFGLTTAAFGTVKFGIAVILLGIVRRIWLRVESVKDALPSLLTTRPDATVRAGSLGAHTSEFGPAVATARAPAALFIHRMARVLWAPMLAMGAMLVGGGLALSFVATANVTADPALAAAQRAWVQGLQFLGEGALLSGISFLLATILGAIREGGGEVQESLGLTVRTLRVPTTAKLFVALMITGLMVEIGQLIGYIYIAVAGDTSVYASFSAALGPLREFGLGVLLAGIVLALATIARALGFQFSRITDIITTGH